MSDIVDCNNCANITATEAQQRQIEKFTMRLVPHRCVAYSTQVYHRTQNRDHSSYIFPCYECVADGHKHYSDMSQTPPKHAHY